MYLLYFVYPGKSLSLKKFLNVKVVSVLIVSVTVPLTYGGRKLLL